MAHLTSMVKAHLRRQSFIGNHQQACLQGMVCQHSNALQQHSVGGQNHDAADTLL